MRHDMMTSLKHNNNVFSLILIFRFDKESISRAILVNLYLVPCFHNIYISLKSIIHFIYVVPICMIMYFKLSYLEEIKYIYLSTSRDSLGNLTLVR